MHVLDSLDAELLLVDGIPNALESLNVGPGVPSLVGFGLVRQDKPLAFIMTKGVHGDVEHSCRTPDGINGGKMSIA